jgi:DNA-binding LytR/AlgR family response regulator
MWKAFFKPQYLNWRWAFCFLASIYFVAFILIFEPFKSGTFTYNYTSPYWYLIFALTGLINVFVPSILLFVIFPKLFPKYFSSSDFTFAKFCISVFCAFVFVVINFYFTSNYFNGLTNSELWFLTYFFKIAIPCILLSGVPFIYIFLTTFDNFTKEQERSEERAAENAQFNAKSDTDSENSLSQADERTPQYMTNKGIPNIEKSDFTSKIFNFTDNTSKKTLRIPNDRLFYITSAQNYVEIHYLNHNNILSRAVLRNSLKAIEEEMILDANSPLLRCHKAFIVNREKVVELRGSTKLAYFILNGIDTHIPISRSRYTELEPQFMMLS